MRQRKKYTDEFKQEAVALVTEQGYKVTEAAKSLGINDTNLRRWMTELSQQDSGDQLSTDEKEELKKLRKQVRELQMEKAILKKASTYFYPVTLICKVMQIKYGSYYAWTKKSTKVILLEELELMRTMKALFEASRHSLGSRMMVKYLRLKGFTIGRYKVRKLMKMMNLKVKTKCKYKVTTDSNHKLPIAENVLDRQFNPDAPNKVWGTDITYVWTQQGWLYLAVVIDLYSRRVVGWCVDKRMTTSLVTRALMMAINLRNPPEGLIHHSDRSSQYASHEYQTLLKQTGMICSMSRKENCWDNSPVERFFSSLKREWIGDVYYVTREHALADIREYVMVYYNSKRLHSTLDYQTPMNFENENTLKKMFKKS